MLRSVIDKVVNTMLVTLTLLLACGVWLQGCANGGGDTILPHGSENSTFPDDSEAFVARKQSFLQRNAYVEGTITNAEYPKEWYDSEEDVQAACNGDVDCKGYWERSNDVYFILKSGSRTFSNGVPHPTVLVVKVKNPVTPAPTPAPVPMPSPTTSPTPMPTPPPPIPTPTYEEGIITNAEYPKEWYDSEEDVQAACSSDVDCKGYWERSNGAYFILKSGSRTFSNGVPHPTVLVVKIKNSVSPVPAPTPAPGPMPVPTTPAPPPSSISTLPPTTMPGSPKYQKWNYYKDGCPTGFEITSQDECRKALASLGVTTVNTWIDSNTLMPRFCSLQKTTNTMIWNEGVGSGSGRHDLAPVCKYTGAPTPPEPTPAPVPDSRDNKTVAPEEWAYFLAFQESRKNGFSCDCYDGLTFECNNIEAAGKHFHPPNPEKVTFDCTLWIAAYRHAEDQGIQNYCSHTAKDGRSPRQRAEAVGAKYAGEHQACHHSQGPAALAGLQTSPPHCNSMFQKSFRGFAVGHGDGPNGDNDIWTVMYNRGGDDISDSESCIPEGYTATGDLK